MITIKFVKPILPGCAALVLSAFAITGCEQKVSSLAGDDSPLPFALERAPQTPKTPPAPAPAGVFYLIDYASVPQKDGIVGIPPGSMVRFEKQLSDGVQVRYGQHSFKAPAEKLTNDTHVAEWVTEVDKVRQRNLSRLTSAQRSQFLQEEERRKILFERAMGEMAKLKNEGKSNPSTSSKLTFESALNRGPYNPSAGSPVHIQAELDGRKFWVDAKGNRHYFFYPPGTEVASTSSELPPAPQQEESPSTPQSQGPDLNQLNQLIKAYGQSLKEIGGQ